MSTRFRGPNVVRCELVTGNQITPIIGAYLPPPTLYHMLDMEEALNCLLGRDHVVLGGINADIVRLMNPQYQHVADFLASFGPVDLLAHFSTAPLLPQPTDVVTGPVRANPPILV